MSSEHLLSKEDAIHILELIHQNLSCAKEEDFRKITNRLSNLISCNFATCAFGKLDNSGNIESFNVMNVSYPSQWLNHYLFKKYYQIDPIIKGHITHFKLRFWVDTYRIHNLPKELISLTEDFGLKMSYTHGMKNPKKGEGSFFSFSGDSIEHAPRTEAILEHLIPHLHQTLNRIIRGRYERSITPPLSQREIEVLNWIKQGKSTWDMSEILNISERTVKFHVSNIMQKLDAVNRPQAIAIAIEQGLIDID